MLHVLFGPLSRQQGSKLKSLRVKYIAFAKDTGAWPLIPTKAANLFRYVLWLPQHGIQSGWKGVMNYVTAICNWNREMGFPTRGRTSPSTGLGSGTTSSASSWFGTRR